MAYLYFDKYHAIRQHDYIIQYSGGFNGIKNEGYLEATLEFVQNDLYYPTIEEKLLTYYMH